MFYKNYGKRLTDLLLTIPALILLSPVIALISLLVRIKHGSPVFFRQERPGLHGKPFVMIKFRTMTNECDENGELLSEEKRVTRLGLILRNTSLDELPELLNVLKGDMSLVGPRPLLMEYLPLYSAEQMRRHDAPAGITGWAQINGRAAISHEEKFVQDVWYVDNQSLWLDIRILFMTVIKIFKREDTSYEGFVTGCPKFVGDASGLRSVIEDKGHGSCSRVRQG